MPEPEPKKVLLRPPPGWESAFTWLDPATLAAAQLGLARDEMCPARHSVSQGICTRPRDHPAPHVATASVNPANPLILAIWWEAK